jgi:hypothetical protein
MYDEIMNKKKLLIFFPNRKVSGEYIEMFPFEMLKKEFDFFGINNREHNSFLKEIPLKLSLLTKKTHALMHQAEMLRRRNASVYYMARIRGEFPSRFDSQHIKIPFHEFKKATFFKRVQVKFFSTIFGVLILKKIVIILFKLENFFSPKLLKEVNCIVLPYTGGISVEWDFLVWLAEKYKITTIAIQENWDNLTSKQFLFMKPKIFATWSQQSSSHLRSIQNFRGAIYEVGCFRIQGFYSSRELLCSESPKSRLHLEPIEKSILVIGLGDELEDFKLLRVMSDLMSYSQNLSHTNLQVVYRVHPHIVESPSRKNNLKLIESLPKIKIYNPGLYETNSERIEQVNSAEIVVSIFSTMVLESAIVNKTCVIPVFNFVTADYNPSHLIDDLNHFSGMSMLTKVKIATTSEEFIDILLGAEGDLSNKINDPIVLNWFCKNTDTQLEIASLIRQYATNNV